MTGATATQSSMTAKYERDLATYNSPARPDWMSKPRAPDPLTDQLQEQFCLFLEGSNKRFTLNHRLRPVLFLNSLDSWCDCKQLHLLHVVRLMEAIGHAKTHHGELRLNTQLIKTHRLTQDKPYGLREIDAAMERVFHKSGLMVKAYLGYEYSSFGNRLADARQHLSEVTAMSKKAKRNSFRLNVFTRDKFCCRCCGVKGKDRQGGDDHLGFHKSDTLADLDSHHITNRNEMPNGGYIKENGISVCDDCHCKAEKWLQDGAGELGFSPSELYALIGSSKEKAFQADLD